MTKHTVSFAVLGLLLIASAATADSLFYLTGKAGTTGIDANIKASLDQLLDSNDASASLGLGVRLGDHLAFELAYHDLGTVVGTVEGTATACPPEKLCLSQNVLLEGKTTAVSLTFLPHLPISDNFFAYGRIGIMSWDTSLSKIAPGLESVIEDYSNEDVVYGAGARFLFPGPIGIFAEYERFGDTFETVSVGATLGF